MGGKNYIADGHHGLAVAWLNGENTADVKFKDLSPRDQAVKSRPLFEVPITKTDEDQNLVLRLGVGHLRERRAGERQSGPRHRRDRTGKGLL